MRGAKSTWSCIQELSDNINTRDLHSDICYFLFTFLIPICTTTEHWVNNYILIFKLILCISFIWGWVLGCGVFFFCLFYFFKQVRENSKHCLKWLLSKVVYQENATSSNNISPSPPSKRNTTEDHVILNVYSIFPSFLSWVFCKCFK